MTFFEKILPIRAVLWYNWLWISGLAVLLSSCRRPVEEGTLLPLPTKICIKTQHHALPIRECNVFVKFNCDTFPGYEQPAEFFDTLLVTGADARICLSKVPEGRHWLVAFGVDDVHYPLPVFGSLPVQISLEKPEVDTILYVSEVH